MVVSGGEKEEGSGGASFLLSIFSVLDGEAGGMCAGGRRLSTERRYSVISCTAMACSCAKKNVMK